MSIFRSIGNVIKLIDISKTMQKFSPNDFYNLLLSLHYILNRISSSSVNDFYKLYFSIIENSTRNVCIYV